ncbi:hypothetical protein F5B17DRAFT_422547 [Nemania serpens]|nr:hypothetical protein F5B17DRAFT_422547 [Nemania serpens]
MLPLLFSLKRLSPGTVVVETNSLLISMACRVSPLLSPDPEHDNTTNPVIPSEYDSRGCLMATFNAEGVEEMNSSLRSTAPERSLDRYSINSCRLQ